MHQTKTELLELIADIKSKKEFEKEINSRYQIYDELIDKDTIAYLIVDELGRNTKSVTKIANLAANKDYTVVGKVLSISDLKLFTRKNGSPGKVVNLEIADDTGRCQLVLWNGDIDVLKNKEIHEETLIKVINGYTKIGYTGEMEIHLGRWGLLEVQPVDTLPQAILKSDDITGVLLGREPTKAYFRDDGEFGFVTTIIIKEHNVKKELILWDRNVKDIQSYQVGDTIVLKNITKKWSNGKTEYHVTQNDSVKKRI